MPDPASRAETRPSWADRLPRFALPPRTGCSSWWTPRCSGLRDLLGSDDERVVLQAVRVVFDRADLHKDGRSS